MFTDNNVWLFTFGTKWTRNDSSPHATPQVTLFIDLYIIISVMT